VIKVGVAVILLSLVFWAFWPKNQTFNLDVCEKIEHGFQLTFVSGGSYRRFTLMEPYSSILIELDGANFKRDLDWGLVKSVNLNSRYGKDKTLELELKEKYLVFFNEKIEFGTINDECWAMIKMKSENHLRFKEN
jgi:hypothetical protein